MDPLFWIIGIGLGVATILIFGWRFLSRRQLLPCPPALIWMLENKIMENVAGSAVLIRRAKIVPGMNVLDAGCGPGRVSIPMAAYVGPEGSVTALDVQVKMLDRVRDRARQAGVDNLEILHVGLGEGKLAASTFDRALMVTVLGEIPDQVSALREIYKALKSGGILSITEVLPDPHYQSRNKVRALAEKCGFTVTEVYDGRRSFTFNLTKPLFDE